MARFTFPITKYQLADTAPVANGYLIINLSKDVTSPSGPVAAKLKAKVMLDENGEITGNPQFWTSEDLIPNDSYYITVVYTATGERIAGPLNILVVPLSGGFGLAFGNAFAS